jgi:hypothetical protein
LDNVLYCTYSLFVNAIYYWSNTRSRMATEDKLSGVSKWVSVMVADHKARIYKYSYYYKFRGTNFWQNYKTHISNLWWSRKTCSKPVKVIKDNLIIPIHEASILFGLKGDGTSVAVLHLYDSFHQKCSKLGTVTTLGHKNKGREWKFKKCYFNAFSRPLKIYIFYEVQTFHSPKGLKYLTGDVSKVSSRL